MKPTRRLNNKGQSLLEVVTALGLAMLIISALVFTTLIGLKNSQLSQNQVLATKLAQEGIETIKSMRDNDTPICLSGGTNYWDKTNTANTNFIWNYTFTTPETVYFTSDPNCLLKPSPIEPAINGKFNRSFIIEYYSLDQIKFTCIVTWEDTSGKHESRITTILGYY